MGKRALASNGAPSGLAGLGDEWSGVRALCCKFCTTSARTGRVHVQMDDAMKALRPRNLKVMRAQTEVNEMMNRVLTVFESFLA